MNSYKDYQAKYLEEYAKLNDAQKQAVDTIDGPVMVIAGPGTGKTQILAARIGNILNETDAAPENILCLTYTDAGAVAMRKRLLTFIGPDAYRVSIYTFHAFCNAVIQDNLNVFGIRELEPLSELEEVELLKELIDGFGSNHTLKRWKNDVYTDLHNLRNLYNLIKSEGYKADELVRKIDEYLEELPFIDKMGYKAEAKKGQLTAVGEKKKKSLERTKAAVQEFDKFQAIMEERGRYDYNDMILWVLDKFKDPDHINLLRRYQERYQYFLVDEYQDTNGAQNQILRHLTAYFDKPNVFVVGDDDQSIYRFQGANMENIASFMNEHEQHLQTIVMTDNYRSSQNILDAAKSLINFNDERLVSGDKKHLVAKGNFATDALMPNIKAYYNSQHETIDIVTKLEELYNQGVNLSEVAVIYRNHRQAQGIIDYLKAKDIPYNIKRRGDILQSDFTQKVINILKYVYGESNLPYSREDLLFDILHYDFFGIDALAMARMAYNMRLEQDEKIREERKKFEPKWRDAAKKANELAGNGLFGDEYAESYRKVHYLSSKLETCIADARNLSVPLMLNKIVLECGIMTYIMQSPDKMWLMQELNTLFNFTKTESQRKPGLKLSKYLETLDLMKGQNITIPIQRITYAENGVNLITAHSSKGLEFEYVFIIDCNAKAWDKSMGNRGFALPGNLVIRRAEANDIEEQRRLFYVGMTRAKKHLQISYPSQTLEEKPIEYSQFVAEIIEKNNIEPEATHVSNDAIANYIKTVVNAEEKPMAELIDENRLHELLEKYTLSVTHLNKYLKCPLTFYFENVLRAPNVKNDNMAFGSAIHYAIEALFNKMKESDNVFPNVDFMIGSFEWSMWRQQDAFTKDQYTRRREYGAKILTDYYNEYIKTWNKVVSIERDIKNVIVKGVPINGKLDKLEFDGSNVNVVDYKTGKHTNSKRYSNFNRPGEKINRNADEYITEYGGNYWRQAVFYKILLNGQRGTNWKVLSTEFDYVEPDENGKFHKEKVVITDEDCRIVEQQIEEVYKKIKNLEFDRGCGKENCTWCTFVKTNYTEIKEPSIEEVNA